MEIEVKARLKDKDGVMERLRSLGCEFSPVKTQDDMVWTEKTGAMEEFLSNKVFLRIRIQNGEKVIFTAKRPMRKDRGELVKQEHEVVVSSAEEMRAILSMLGYTEAVRAIKKRQTGAYGGYEICIDEVEGLGSFIELEKMDGNEEADHIQKRNARIPPDPRRLARRPGEKGLRYLDVGESWLKSRIKTHCFAIPRGKDMLASVGHGGSHVRFSYCEPERRQGTSGNGSIREGIVRNRGARERCAEDSERLL